MARPFNEMPHASEYSWWRRYLQLERGWTPQQVNEALGPPGLINKTRGEYQELISNYIKDNE